MVYGDIRNWLIYTEGSGVGVSSTNYATGEVRRLLPSASLRVTCGQGVVPGQPPDQGYVKLGLSTSCSATFWQLLVFRATFCILSNFSTYLLILRHRAAFTA